MAEPARYRTIPEPDILEILLLEGFAYELEEGGQTAERARCAAAAALDAWRSRGLLFTASAEGVRLFDPVEVTRFMILEAIEGRDRFWLDRWVAQSRRCVIELLSAAELGDPQTPPRCFDVVLQRTFNIRADAGARRLRAPMPIPRADLDQVDIALLADGDPEARLTLTEGRLEARLSRPADQELTLRAQLRLTARHHGGVGGRLGSVDEPYQAGGPSRLPEALSAADRALYLRSHEGFIVLTPRIVALAWGLAGAASEPATAVGRFWNYLLGALRISPMHYDQVDPAAPADWSLDHGWCDCQLGSALLASLCRAIGVPARLVSGYFLYRLMPLRHYWAEVWIEGRGWTPFDFFCWRLAAGGQDPDWRNYFAGRLDYRVTTERFPLTFTGATGVAYPPIWQMAVAATPGGAQSTFTDLDGTLLYRDSLQLGKAFGPTPSLDGKIR